MEKDYKNVIAGIKRRSLSEDSPDVQRKKPKLNIKKENGVSSIETTPESVSCGDFIKSNTKQIRLLKNIKSDSKQKILKNSQLKGTCNIIKPKNVRKNLKIEEEIEKKPLKKEVTAKSTSKLLNSENVKPKISQKKTEILLNENHELVERVSRLSGISSSLTLNIIKLLNEEATIPFIVRYRKHLVNNMDAEKLRDIRNNIELVQNILSRKDFIIKKLESLSQFTPELLESLKLCNSIEELDCIYEPFKPLKKNKVVEGKNLGFFPIAENILHGKQEIKMECLRNEYNQFTEDEIEALIVELVASIIGNDPTVVKKIQYIKDSHWGIHLTAKLKKIKSLNEKELDIYKQYSDFSQDWKKVKPFKVLAINRGVGKGILSSAIVIPSTVKDQLLKLINWHFFRKGRSYYFRKVVLFKSMELSYTKYMENMLKKIIRNELRLKAEKASLEVFSSNLKWLLLSPPIRGFTVLSIDPGFFHGCKIAIVSPVGNVLATDVCYLTSKNNAEGINKLKQMVENFKVDLIAIGNGKGCREVEGVVGSLQKTNSFKKKVQTVVIPEDGASIYSCSKEAKAEFPELDPNLISAITLARRVQDPMSELVKIEPKHLGVGMYQHDASKKKLENELSDVVMECVSNVGVDLNTASIKLLQYVSGLSEKRAKSIVDQRNKEGSFLNRKELKFVKGIGKKTFEQCAGFVRIVPETVVNADPKLLNPLDCTEIHPEFYHIAEKVLKDMGLNKEDLGTDTFISKVKSCLKINQKPYEGISKENLDLIYQSFMSPPGKDLRLELGQPLFNREIKSLAELEIGQTLLGRVANVTDFGVFVDVGIEKSGLVPKLYLNQEVHLGNRVKVKVMDKDLARTRLTLSIISVF